MTVTIFTPTYNRKLLLSRLYESLCAQTLLDFEWLIVDDGSLDGTSEYIQSLVDRSPFPIQYYYKTNGGKASAYNYALQKISGDLFFCVDSDDWLCSKAVETIIRAREEMCRQKSTGILMYKQSSDGVPLSHPFPANISTSSLADLEEKYGCNGEYSVILDSATAKAHPYPSFSNETFVGESIIYDRIGRSSGFLLLGVPITICEYQPNGLTANINQLMKSNPGGYCLYFMQRIDLTNRLKNRVVIAGKYHCFRLFAKEKATAYTGNHRILVALCQPLGCLFRLYYKLFRGF